MACSLCWLDVAVTVFFRTPFSFGLDPQLLDERPPFLGIGLHQRAERFRRLLFAGKNLQSEIGETRSQGRIGQRFHGRRIELGDRVVRRAPRAKNPYQEE